MCAALGVAGGQGEKADADERGRARALTVYRRFRQTLQNMPNILKSKMTEEGAYGSIWGRGDPMLMIGSDLLNLFD